jgi:hypothetical protein
MEDHMFDVPKLVFKIALADLISLAAKPDEKPLRRRDLDVVRQLVAAALAFLRTAEDADPDELAAATQIRDLSLKTLTTHLEAVHNLQQSVTGHRLSNLDLTAMSIYRRTFKLSEVLDDFGIPIPADTSNLSQTSTASTVPATDPTLGQLDSTNEFPSPVSGSGQGNQVETDPAANLEVETESAAQLSSQSEAVLDGQAAGASSGSVYGRRDAAVASHARSADEAYEQKHTLRRQDEAGRSKPRLAARKLIQMTL